MAKFNEYPVKATPADNDTLMIYDATSKANKLSPFSGIWNWIVGKLTNAVISNLETQNKSVVGALNELNSNLFSTAVNPPDLNALTSNGVYTCGSSGITSNMPVKTYGLAVVFNCAPYIAQIFIADLNMYSRLSADCGNSWADWKIK
nr:MAG TPA: putative tail fiber protein [Caudoviricetes sp.]